MHLSSMKSSKGEAPPKKPSNEFKTAVTAQIKSSVAVALAVPRIEIALTCFTFLSSESSVLMLSQKSTNNAFVNRLLQTSSLVKGLLHLFLICECGLGA